MVRHFSGAAPGRRKDKEKARQAIARLPAANFLLGFRIFGNKLTDTMRFFGFMIAVLFLGLNTVQGQRTPKGWHKFRSPDGAFEVMAPKGMQSQVDSVSTAIGVLAYHTFFHSDNNPKAENAVYMVSYVDYPPGAIHSDSVALLPEFYEATLESALTSVQGKLIYRDIFRHQGYTGRLWRIDYNRGEATVRTRAVVIKNRYYAIQTITHRKKNVNRSMDQFFDSFKVYIEED